MSVIPTLWELPPEVTPAIHARLNWLHPVIRQIFFSRGLVDLDEVHEFYGQRVRPDDPFRLKGVNEAVARLRQAIRQGEPIAVYGDFDADGVTSTALMVQTLAALGADVQPYIPHRVDEGYGLNDEALASLHASGVRVVLTVDCGIRANSEVRNAMALGLDVIVTDHHSLGQELPPALVVINPRQRDSGYPFDSFAGVGVAFKLAQALLRAESRNPISPAPLALTEDDLLDLVALGTVADLMPLRGENRVLVQRGLEQLNLGRRPGLRALARAAGVQIGKIDATAIGFRLGPRLNAAGRLRSAALAYDLLMAKTEEEAELLAEELNLINRERQRLTQDAVIWAMTELGDEPADDVILIGRENLNPGIVGLIASRLKDSYYRPSLVVELGDDEVRGSARSIPEFHITEALDQCADLLVRYGGHAAAAGFTVRSRDLPTLRRRLNDLAAAQISPEDRVQRLPIDAVVTLSELDYALLGKLHELEPTGSGNPQPALGISRLRVKETRLVGSDGSHLKLRLSDDVVTIDAIGFGLGSLGRNMPAWVDVACHFEENVWQDRRTLQLQLLDVKPAGGGIPDPAAHKAFDPASTPLLAG
ncbi:MAG: single-stranded-DNA-specific exonuclease RecJ [Caldilineales bacterium]|nr:single-stranded-DNA-specific exonuclease RecJ [Caldilineales bacterium]